MRIIWQVQNSSHSFILLQTNVVVTHDLFLLLQTSVVVTYDLLYCYRQV